MITGPARPLIAWVVIIGVVVWIAGFRDSSEPEGAIPEADDAQRRGGEELAAATLEFQARVFVGMAENSSDEKRFNIASAIDSLRAGDLNQRIGHVILVGELRGAFNALDAIDELHGLVDDNDRELTGDEAFLLDRLEIAYRDYVDGKLDAPSLDEQDRRFIEDRLGWLGSLALCPRSAPSYPSSEQRRVDVSDVSSDEARRTTRQLLLKQAKRTVNVASRITMLFFGFGFVGLGMLARLVWMYSNKRTVFGIGGEGGYGGVYAETFAVWMVLFVGLSMLASVFKGKAPIFVVHGAASFGSLLALAWPVLRGVSWRRVRRDIGWTAGRRPLVEPWIGFTTYAMCLPLMVVGGVLYAINLHLGGELDGLLGGDSVVGGSAGGDLDPVDTPSHPVIEPFLAADWSGRLHVYFLACVAAPIVEETMFRGVLYRHLRELTSRFRLAISAVLSAFVSSFIFAVIHPQGLAAVPLLMALSIGFSIAREWRSTLIPSVIAHGLSNAVLLTAVLLLLSG